jgi:uncharacterized protein (TIGR00369 family)
VTKPKAGKAALQRLLDSETFLRPWKFRVVSVGDGTCTVVMPLREALLRPGRIVNGPALMAAADVAMWLAIKARHGMDYDALTSDLNTAFLRPAKNVPVYCTGRILRAGRRRFYGVAECHDKAGNLFSHHTVTYVQPA